MGVNLVTAYCSLLHWIIMKTVGLRPYTVETEPGTVMKFWVPYDTVSKKKPVVVLLHGFCGDGILNWTYQVVALTKDYEVYVPDLVFFGGSVTDKKERSPEFQAECLAAGLEKLGVEKCVVVGFSYGGYVALKMAEIYVDMVEAVVVSGTIMGVMKWIVLKAVEEAGFSSCEDMLLPNSVDKLKKLLSVGSHKNFWFPDWLYTHFLQAMYSNRKEQTELLEALVDTYKDLNVPNIQQRVHLLWGENDKFFKVELAQKMKEKLGNNATFESIKNAGHLVHIERPLVYNKCLKQFLSCVLQVPATKI